MTTLIILFITGILCRYSYWLGMKKGVEVVDNKALYPISHEACDAFWDYWNENGETHKHGYYESTWGAIRAYLEKAAVTKDQRAKDITEITSELIGEEE